MGLLDQCHEVLHDVFCYLDGEDLGNLSSTCTALRNYIASNRLLWKTVYINTYDDPTPHNLGAEPDWEAELKSFTQANRILKAKSKQEKAGSVKQVASHIIKLMKQASPEYDTSKNINLLKSQLKGDNVDIFALNSNLFQLARHQEAEEQDEELSLLIAHVHCLLGTQFDNLRYDTDIRAALRSSSDQPPTLRKVHPFARAQVYDMRLCSLETRWGPWSRDGKFNVDWERVECLMIDLAYNVNRLAHHSHSFIDGLWKKPFKGTSPNSYSDSFPLSTEDPLKDKEELEKCPVFNGNSSRHNDLDIFYLQPDQPLDALDPYGITGTWQRIVCFLDYGDFYFVNYSRRQSLTERRPPIDHDEAIRLILMRLQVTKIEPVPDSPLPIVHFTGTSRSMHQGWDPNANYRLQGTVSLTPEGEVRWSTLSIFHGEPRWRSEAIQIGGPRSGRGIIGSWFEKDMDSNGPMGPTASWKLTDRTQKGMNTLAWRRTPNGIELSFDGPEASPYGIAHYHDDDDFDDDEEEDEEWEEDENAEEDDDDEEGSSEEDGNSRDGEDRSGSALHSDSVASSTRSPAV